MTTATLPRPYYRVLGASSLSNLADGIRMAAFPLLAASLTDDARLIALVFAAGEAPWIVFGLWAGNVADRLDRQRLTAQVSAARALLLFALAGLILAGAVPFWLVVSVAFILGIAEVFADSAAGTLVPSIVEPDQLERANSRMVAAQIAGNELVGPAAGGILFAAGAALPFLTNGTLLTMAFFLLAGLHLTAQTQPDAETETEDDRWQTGLFDGFPFISNRPLLRTITAVSAILAAVDAAWFALLVLFVQAQLGFGAGGFGLALAVGAVGGLAGAAIADHHPNQPMSAVTAVVFGSSAGSLILLGAVPTPAATFVVLAVTSGAFAVWNVHVVATRQRATPHHLLGRVGAAFRTVVIAASIMGAIGGGVLADLTSVRTALAGYGVLLLAVAPLAVVAVRRAEKVGETDL